MNIVKLKNYNNSWYKPSGMFKKLLWYVINLIIFKNSIPFPSLFKVKILKLFNSKIGTDVIIKPSVNIKYPWLLEIGSHVWIGENVWIDNLAQIKIGNNVVISQGSYLLTGSHDYKKTTFDLLLGEIVLEDGVWIGAKAIVCPGVTCESHSVLSVGSIATNNLSAYTINQGNPSSIKRTRTIR